MHVNSVSLSSKATNTAFKATPEEQLFVNLRDEDIRKVAWAKASKDVNDRKHQSIDNALLFSLPLAGGLSAAVREISPEAIAKYGAKNLRAIRVGRFGLVTASWAAGLTALGALWGTKDYLAKKVDVIKNNPVISSLATFVAGFGVLSAVNKIGYKGLMKLIGSIDESKYLPLFRNVRNALNNSKVINKASEYISKFPSPIKDIAKGTAELAPLLVIGTQIGHIFGHQKVRADVASKNYAELKEVQQNIKDNIADSEIDKHIG